MVYLQALTVLALAQLRERDDKIAELEAAAVISRECTTELEENLLAASLLKTRALCVRATWAGRAGLGYPHTSVPGGWRTSRKPLRRVQHECTKPILSTLISRP